MSKRPTTWGLVNHKTGSRNPRACRKCKRTDRPYSHKGFCTACSSRVNFSKVCERCKNPAKPYYAKGCCRYCYDFRRAELAELASRPTFAGSL